MADQKVSELSADTSPTKDDLTYLVNDPGGTPGDRKVTLEDLLTKPIGGFTSDTAPTTDDVIAVLKDPSGTPGAKKVAFLDLFKTLGPVAQIVEASTTGVATGTTTIPADDTIPQITEGTEFLTLAITPKATTNKLFIEAVLMCSPSVAVGVVAALFQDATANALATALSYVSTNNGFAVIALNYSMTAGTTSSTTFRLRAGPYTAATLTVNGQSGGRLFGGTSMTSLRIIEMRA